MPVVPHSAVSLARVKATVRALLPLLVTLCCLVFGLVATPAAAAGGPVTPTATPTGGGSNHTGNVTLYDAGNATLDGADGVESAIENGTVDPAGRVVVNDTLLVVIESERLASTMDGHDGSTTEAFVAALNGTADLYLVQTNPNTMVTRTFALVGPENATAYRDGTTVYALLDTNELWFRKKAADGMRTHDSFYGDEFAVDFGFDLYEPPWEPPGDGPRGPAFVLSDERFLTETPEPTPTHSSTPTDSPTQTRTPTAPPLTPGLTTTGLPTTGSDSEATGAGTPTSVDTPLPAPTANGSSPQSATRTTTFEDGAGFTAGTTLVALFWLVLLGRRWQ